MLAPSLRFPDDDDPIAELVFDFEEAWRSGSPRIDQFRSRLGVEDSTFGLAELVKVDLQQRYRRGERPSARDYFDRYPDLLGEDGHALTLIYEEYCLLAKTDDAVSPSAFCDRYPTWHSPLVSQLAYHRELSRAVEPLPSVSDFPEEGDRFLDCELVRLLGQGGAARVFLARDGNLGGREFVLKISRDQGSESAALGKLDHENIVGVYNVIIDPVSGFRGLCMPYRPGLALNDVLTRFRHGEKRPSLGSIEAVVRPTHSDGRVEEARRLGWTDFPASGSYADGVAWIGLKIALALEHAHKSGIFHRDVKPENILISLRDGVQLIDFNLACDTNLGDLARAAHRGGTLPYMAREHLQAFLDPTLWPKVDARADLFSLGLVLREMLTLKPVERLREANDLPRTINDLIRKRSAPRIPIRRINPKVPHAIEAIVAKCLGEAPEDRYRSAGDLAKDLGRYLARRPLIVAKNGSKVEVARNWVASRWRFAAVAAGIACLSGFSLRSDGGLPPAVSRPVVSGREETRTLIEQLRIGIQTGHQPKLTALNEKVLGRPDAEDEFRLASKAHPESFTLAMGYATASSNAGRLDVAIEAYRHAIALNPKFAAYQGLAAAQFGLGIYQEALESIDRAFDLFKDEGTAEDHRDYVKSLVVRAQILFALGDQARDEEAEEHKAKHPKAKIDKRFPTARDYFAKGLNDLNELHDRAKTKTSPSIEFSYHYLSAMIRISLGDLDHRDGADDAALASYRTALDHVDSARRNAAGRESKLDELKTKLDDRLRPLLTR